MVINASDDNILPKPANPLTYSLTITKGTDPSFDIDMGSTSTFTGTPLVADVGTYTVYVNVNDGCVKTPWGPVTVQVDCNEPPEITSQPVITVCLGEEYTYQVTATDPETDPLVYSLTTKPDGMSISSTGLITWTPATKGDYDVVVEVSDGCSSDTQGFTVTVNPSFVSFELSTDSLTLCAGDSDTFGITATYSDGPRTLYLDSTGVRYEVSGGVTVTDEPTNEITASSSGSITVFYEDTGLCGTEGEESATITVTVNPCNDLNYIFVRGYNSAPGCMGMHNYEYETTSKPVNHNITMGPWLFDKTNETPNVKNINFIVRYDNPLTTIEYKYKYKLYNTITKLTTGWIIGSDWSAPVVGSLADDGTNGYGFESGCMEAPSITSTKDYCIEFEFEIRVNGDSNTYTVNID